MTSSSRAPLLALAVCLAAAAALAAPKFPAIYFTPRGEQRSVALRRPAPPYLEQGPLLGHVSSHDARFWVKASSAARFSLRVGQKDDLSDAWRVKGPALEAETRFIGQSVVADLKPSQRYFYCVLLDGKPAMSRPFPSFVSAPPEGAPDHVRVGFVSCVGYFGSDSAGTWGDMQTRTNFDLLLMLGDNHYANSTDPDVLETYYGVQRHLAGYAEISRRLPQYAIWDNHDYGPEPCDKTAPERERALQVFKNFWPNPAFGETNNPGVYFKFTYGPIDFFMTDGRYHRDPNDAREDGHKSMLGATQLAWLKRELLASKAAVKVIGSGGEFQTFGQKNSWTSFKRERDELLHFIEEHGLTGVLLVSGDRHFTAAYQVLGKFIEVSSGPTGSKNSETQPTPEMFFYNGKGKFYCIFDVDTTRAKPAITLEIYRTGDGLIERRRFTWEEVIGVTKIKPLPAAAARTETARGARTTETKPVAR